MSYIGVMMWISRQLYAVPALREITCRFPPSTCFLAMFIVPSRICMMINCHQLRMEYYLASQVSTFPYMREMAIDVSPFDIDIQITTTPVI